MKKNILLSLCVIIILIAGCGQFLEESTPIVVSDFALNTYVSITVYSKEDEAVAKKALGLCKDYENIFSRTNDSTPLSLLNRTGNLTNCDESLYELIATGIEYGILSNGALDITTEPLTSLWAVSSDNPVVPDASTISALLPRIDYNNIIIEDATHSVRLEDGASIDLGAIAKGYIADKIHDFLIENKIKHAIINLGGNIICIGNKPDNTNYNIAIRKPFAEVTDTILSLSVRDMSVVTSGTYERFFSYNDTIYHHIIDPFTGYPAASGLISVTIISPTSVTGDCLSTSCLVLGLDKGIELIDSIDDVYGIFIDEDMNIYYSSGAKDFVNQ